MKGLRAQIFFPATQFSALTATQYVALHFHCLISFQGVVLNLKLEHLLAFYTTF